MEGVSDVSKFKTGISQRRAVWLKERDFDLLNLIYVHGILTKKQMYYYGFHVYGLSNDTLKKKFRRWRDKGILEYEKYGPHKALYYRIGAMGTDILQDSGKVPKNSKVTNNSDTILPKNKDHFIGLRDLIIRTLTETKRTKLTLFSYSPYVLEYKKDNKSNSVLIRPDWILKHERQHYDLEIDTGTEGHAKIKGKLEGYIQLAKLNPTQSHHVIVAVMTNSDAYFTYIHDRYGLNRTARVLNLKNVAIDIMAHNLPNLKVSIAPINRMHLITKKWIKGDYTDSHEEIKADVSVFKTKLYANESFSYSIGRSLNASDFYLAEVNESLYADDHVLLTSDLNGEEKTMVIKLMYEGDVRRLDQLRYLNQLKREGRFKKEVDFIVAVYQSKDEMENDSIEELENVLFTSLDSFENQHDSPFIQKGKVTLI